MDTVTQRTCPVCSSALDTIVHEGVEIDRCPAGCGLWLDRGELRAVVASELEGRAEDERRDAVAAAARDAGHAVVAESARPRRACPVCAEEMQLVEYARSGIAIDECGLHGVWLDAGELERIEAYAEGIRRQAASGVLARTATGVHGIDIPADLLATIRTAGVSRRSPESGA